MKKIKVFALPSHATVERTSGVDYVRIISPMEELWKHPDFDVTVWRTDMDMKWPDIARKYDIIYFGYLNNDWGFAAMGAMARHFKKKLVMDIDDDLWEILPDNVAYDVYKPGSQGIKNISAIVREVDLVTCTNQYLKNAIAHSTGKKHDTIQVLPNYINLETYNYVAKDKDTHTINIGHFGSTTHFASLQDNNFVRALDRIMKDYPQVTFTTIGSFIGAFKDKWGSRYFNKFGDVDVYKWIGVASRPLFDEIDFFVTPIIDNVYNRCKSATKFNEVSSYKRSGVWQNIRQYREVIDNGKNGFLASGEKDWYDSMKALIESHDLRVSMAQSAYNKVKENYTIQSHVEDYAQMFKNLLTNK